MEAHVHLDLIEYNGRSAVLDPFLLMGQGLRIMKLLREKRN